MKISSVTITSIKIVKPHPKISLQKKLNKVNDATGNMHHNSHPQKVFYVIGFVSRRKQLLLDYF